MTVLIIVLGLLVLTLFLFGFPGARRSGFGPRWGSRFRRGPVTGRWGRRL